MSQQPPRLTLCSRLLIRAIERTAAWAGVKAFLGVGAFAGGVIALDYVTGAAYSVNFLYLFACALAVWCLGEKSGLVLAFTVAVVAASIKHLQVQGLYVHPIGAMAEAWNLLSRMLSFTLFAVVVSGLKGVLALERWRGSHDELTGALNKAGFRRAFGETVSRIQARGGNLLFAYMDLDGFKAVNDQFGHAAGDLVLGAFGGAAQAAIRPNDHFARIGGDEFAVVLALPATIDGGRVAELLHARLSAILRSTGYEVTCSMGAVFVAAGETTTAESLTDQADALMYEAKRAGKNALRVARGNALSKTLRSAFLPMEDDELDDLLRRIDLAERRHCWQARRAA